MSRAADYPAPCLVYATRKEAEPAIQAIRGEPAGQLSGLFTGRMPGSARKLLLLITGMGPKAAHRAMLGLFAAMPVSGVINLGIAGSLHPRLGIGQLCAIGHADLEAGGDLRGPGRIPLQPLPGLPRRSLVSVHTPVFDDARRSALAAAGADLVDMEGAAVAWACRERRIPCRMIKGISDLAGTGGRQTLHENLPELSRALAAELFRRESLLHG